MRLLLDTNIIIAAEPTAVHDVEAGAEIVVELVRLAHAGGHQLQIHPATLQEIARDKDEARRTMGLALARKYPTLPKPPPIDHSLLKRLGLEVPGENTTVDLTILTALQANCADYFVTDDQRLRKRARRLGLGERAISAADAAAVLRALFPTVPAAPPLVHPCFAHELSITQRIFDSLRASYAPFDLWFAKCQTEQRQCWVVKQQGDIAALTIVNEEKKETYGLGGKILKVCTFKVSPEHRGFRFGELLLKTLFDYAFDNKFDAMFVEAFPRHAELFDLLEAFGFENTGRTSDKGEAVVAKTLVPTASCETMDALEFHRLFGPRHLCLDVPMFVVPVQPQYHDLLFPAHRPQLQLVEESHPFGNGMRKAYLCHSQMRRITPGSVLLFYRSKGNTGMVRGAQSITVIGVAEETLVSRDADEIARYVGRRTVYSRAAIGRLAEKKVLSVTFRLARTLTDPWSLQLLKSSGILKGAPQSIAEVPSPAVPWIKAKLAESR